MIEEIEMLIAGDGEDYRRVTIVAIDEHYGNKLLGHLSLDLFKEVASATWVFVDSEYRNQGIATQLLDRAWEITLEKGYDQLTLVVNKSPEQEKICSFYVNRELNIGMIVWWIQSYKNENLVESSRPFSKKYIYITSITKEK